MRDNTAIDENVKKILIIGANGFLGRNLLRFGNKSPKFNFIAADLENEYIDENITFCHIDITKYEDLLKKLTLISPDFIILTAAMTDVDQNEVYKELATKINTDGPANVTKICEKINSKLIFMSTDFVFDGTLEGRFYTEEDPPHPISHYGKTKYEAELAIQNTDNDYVICRTAVLYGWNPYKSNYITWILEKLKKKEQISIVTTQINNATFVPNLAEIILKLVDKNASGIYHTAGDNPMSRYEMAVKCAEIFEYDKNLIKPIEHFEQKAARPKNAGLDK